MRWKQWLVVLLVVFPALSATGCGQSQSDVTGTVTLDGEPLSDGTIIFFPANGPAVSTEIKAGKYTAPKVPTGEAKVTVDNNLAKGLVQQSKNDANPRKDPSQGKPPIGGGGDMPADVKAALEKQQQQAAEATRRTQELIDNYRPIPEKYSDSKNSGLKVTVGSGTTKFDVPLTSK